MNKTKQLIKDTNFLITGLLIALLILGVTLPAITLKKFFVGIDGFSIIGGTWALLDRGEILSAVIIFVVMVVMPLASILLGWQVQRMAKLASKQKLRWLKSLWLLSKFSLAELYVLAIVMALVFASNTVTLETHLGFITFALAILATTLRNHALFWPYQLSEKASRSTTVNKTE